jgi:hypothetical protein
MVPNFIFAEIVQAELQFFSAPHTNNGSASTTGFIFTFIILYIGYTRTCVIGSIILKDWSDLEVFGEEGCSRFFQSSCWLK